MGFRFIYSLPHSSHSGLSDLGLLHISPMDTFLPFFIRSFRNPHGWNLPDHAILTVLNTSGFMAWKPSYGDAEVARFLFTYSLE